MLPWEEGLQLKQHVIAILGLTAMLQAKDTNETLANSNNKLLISGRNEPCNV